MAKSVNNGEIDVAAKMYAGTDEKQNIAILVAQFLYLWTAHALTMSAPLIVDLMFQIKNSQ